MKFHALMPFYRKHHLEKLISHFETMNLIWHPVCDPVDIQAFDGNTRDWINPLLCAPLRVPGDQCYRKINDFIDADDIVDDDYYGFIHDDDMYVPGYIEWVKQQTAKIIICSAHRGHRVSKEDGYPHPIFPLVIKNLNDIHVYNIDFCQLIVKGSILRITRFINQHDFDDGLYAENLRDKWPDDILIHPGFGIYFNYFQPGRYDVDERYGI
ncbi:MAG: hypothetical protein WC374_08985 [Phycisphaerae bacterium]|jgi:hypothetical protein